MGRLLCTLLCVRVFFLFLVLWIACSIAVSANTAVALIRGSASTGDVRRVARAAALVQSE